MEDLSSPQRKQALKCVAGSKPTMRPELGCHRTFLAVSALLDRTDGAEPCRVFYFTYRWVPGNQHVPPGGCGGEPILFQSQGTPESRIFWQHSEDDAWGSWRLEVLTEDPASIPWIEWPKFRQDQWREHMPKSLFDSSLLLYLNVSFHGSRHLWRLQKPKKIAHQPSWGSFQQWQTCLCHSCFLAKCYWVPLPSPTQF